MIIFSAFSSAIFFCFFAVLFGNPPIIMSIVGFFSGIIVAIVLNKVIK